MAEYRNIVKNRQIEETAERLLDEYIQKTGAELQAPIPIMEIGHVVYGLQQRSKPSQGVSGALFENERILYTNTADQRDRVWGEQRTRFTIAHEIAHYILAQMDENDVNTRILWGTRKKKSPKQMRETFEILADQIAASLLMPRKIVISEAEKIRKINEETITKLAERFNVSLQAMAKRIKRLVENGERLNLGVSLFTLEELGNLIHEIRSNRNQWDHARQSTEISVYQVEEQDLAERDISKNIRQAIDDLLFGHGMVKVPRGKAKDANSSLNTMKRPIVIEFAGTPNSGKDTQINILTHYLRDRLKLRVHVINDGYRFSDVETSEHTALDRSRQATFRLLDQMIDLLDNRPKHDIVLINKGIFDNVAFQRFLTRIGKQNQDEEMVFTSLLLQERWRQVTNLVILLIISPEESIAREQQEIVSAGALLAGKMDAKPISSDAKLTMNLNNLFILNESYSSASKDFGELFKSLRQIHLLPEDKKEEIAMRLAPDLNNSLSQTNNATDTQTSPPKPHKKKKTTQKSLDIQPNLL